MVIRLRGLQRRVGTRGLTRHLSQTSQDHPTAKHHFWKALHQNFEGCADRWEKDADHRKRTQENCRTHETLECQGTRSQVDLRKHHKKTPQQRQAQCGNQWNVVQTTHGGSNTIPMRQQPELGQSHRVRWNILSISAAGYRNPSRKFLFASTEIAARAGGALLVAVAKRQRQRRSWSA